MSFIVVEEILSSFTIYWHLPFGLMLMAIVVFVRGGLMGLLRARDAER